MNLKEVETYQPTSAPNKFESILFFEFDQAEESVDTPMSARV